MDTGIKKTLGDFYSLANQEVCCRGDIYTATDFLGCLMYGVFKTPAKILASNRRYYRRKQANNPRWAAQRKAKYRQSHPVKLTPAQRHRAREASRRFRLRRRIGY